MSQIRASTLIIICLLLFKINGSTQDTLKFRPWPIEKLKRPFGTILALQVEIYDGSQLHNKFHEGSYLFKIKSVDSVLLPTPILMEFKDEDLHGFFPTNDFELYKYFYGIDTGVLNEKDIKKIKKKYVGQEFTVVGYESGEFFGSPSGVIKYSVITATPFHFRNYFIVIADLSNKNKWHEMKESIKD